MSKLLNDNKKKYNKSFDVILHFGHIWVCTPKYINLVLYFLANSPWTCAITLRWRHNDRDGVSNHQPYDYLLNRLFRHRSKKTSKLHVTGLCARNSPVTGEFPAQKASNAENVSIWWRHHACHPTPLIQLIQHRRVLSATWLGMRFPVTRDGYTRTTIRKNTFISMTICLAYRGYMCIY